jgi:hypothetical protein
MLWEEWAGGGFMNVVGLDCDLRRDWINGSRQTSMWYQSATRERHRRRMNKIFAFATDVGDRLL